MARPGGTEPALIDPLLVGTALSRRVMITAKATLFDNPALSPLLRAVGVVPLRRAKDEDDLVEKAQAHLSEKHPGREYDRDAILFMAY